MDLTTLTNGTLIKLLEKSDAALTKAQDAVFAAEPSNNVRFCDILDRLVTDDPALVVAYSEARAALDIAKDEARRRVGPVQFDMLSTYITYLENQKRCRRAGSNRRA